ncbi:ejaculatory bulb-specific protein 3-like [Copidosoma floridanum]|uniref:ejaculatory bulb-specific protein 3-like n=1 Tax=Copidosoma floridanum TaxID=29053 RepID=UPI0006C9C808|nr:ejaculatory bulb-specific protein 3-like [Copidosoma floridanum]
MNAYLVLASVVWVSVLGGEEVRYTTKYDNVDIESVIGNERLLAGYVGCLLETKPCSPDAAELKRNLPDALATNCSRCSSAQKTISERLTHHLIDNKPDEWSLLEQRYDPTGAYRERYLGISTIKEKDQEEE